MEAVVRGPIHHEEEALGQQRRFAVGQGRPEAGGNPATSAFLEAGAEAVELEGEL